MASLTIRNIDEETKARLRVAAARAGHSMEEHVRLLIDTGVHSEGPPIRGFGSWMHGLFKNTHASGFAIPPRDEMAEPMGLPR